MERAEKQFPVGSGEKFVEKRKELSLPAAEVANKVLWVNPAFKEAPFKLERGKPAKLGLFFAEKINPNSPDAISQKQHGLSLMPEGPVDTTGRSGLVGEVVFRDADGNLWRDVDAKGVGAFFAMDSGYFLHAIEPIDENSEKEKTAYGLLDYGYALRDKEYSEKFLKAGIRTHRVIALIEPKEIMDLFWRQHPLAIKEAKGTMGIIPKLMRPVIAVRAFGTRERIAHLANEKQEKRGQAAIEDARLLVAQELGKKSNRFSVSEYAEWFAETLGKQVAKIKKMKWHHGYITPHNITLDCRIVDLDSVTTADETLKMKGRSGYKWTIADVYRNDFERARSTLRTFAHLLEEINHAKYTLPDNAKDWLLKKFDAAYHKELRIETIKEKKTVKKYG